MTKQTKFSGRFNLRNFPEDLYVFFKERAEYNNRTVPQEILWTLKMVQRQAELPGRPPKPPTPNLTNIGWGKDDDTAKAITDHLAKAAKLPDAPDVDDDFPGHA